MTPKMTAINNGTKTYDSADISEAKQQTQQ